MGRVNLGHYVLGIEGMALLRTWLAGPRELADRRVEELARFLADRDTSPLAAELEVADEDVAGGYARWAGTYDALPNPLILVEEPAVRALLDALPVGRALDAACGTGRHAAYLHARGHTVIGVDATPEMLDCARVRLPGVDFRTGDLGALPAADASMDLVVCALALTHCPDLGPPIAELARVLRPGGCLVVSDLHPFVLLLGGSALFPGSDGRLGNVRSYPHLPGAYLRGFRDAGLVVDTCVEPLVGEREIALIASGTMDLAPEAFRTALGDTPLALVWGLTRR